MIYGLAASTTPDSTGISACALSRSSRRRNSGRFASNGSRPRNDNSSLQIRRELCERCEQIVSNYQPSAIIAVHRSLSALGEPAFRRLGGAFDGGVQRDALIAARRAQQKTQVLAASVRRTPDADFDAREGISAEIDRKSTRLNSSHVKISYAVFC